jgi:hypothetical protein
MFNLGAGEITLLVVFTLIIIGPKRLPDLGEGLRARLSTPTRSRWAWSDWALLIAACAFGAVALTLLTGVRP